MHHLSLASPSEKLRVERLFDRMFPTFSRSLSGALCLLSLVALVRCGGTPQVPSDGTPIGASGGDAAGGRSGSGSGGSWSISTGNAPNDGGCSGSDCGEGGAPPEPADICGDGVVGKSEECDDGNAKPGDGCSGVCEIDPGYDCPTAGAECVVS